MLYLFDVFVQRELQITHSVAEHLTGHECVEDGRTHQRNTEIKTKQPPDLHIPVHLQTHIQVSPLMSEQHTRFRNTSVCHI